MNDTSVRIEPMTLDHVEGYRRALDAVARERKYLTMLRDAILMAIVER